MNGLEYRTRGEITPNNKPNVYFSAHPDDFDIYFEVLSEEILRCSNCAVWYGASGRSLNDTEHLFDLEQMHLFVFPITARFLQGDHIALQEFRYALSRCIPILPIAVERGLEKQFEAVCGNIQFVDKTSTDITAMGYEERLSRFLNSVLIDDDTAQKIRDAFDAYIFLSYRKKDRKYAQKLMHLIHMNEQCRDIAIWYDEFLIPGKDFKDAIDEMMGLSRAFVLTVTPNLLEDGNYVQKIEYPFAKALEKPILAFEVLETDRNMLEEKFEGLSECVSADEESVTQCMLQAYASLAIQPKERNATHNFFVGLAYLNGMDVEKDFDKAVELISDAAEDGLPEAMKKLIFMYSEAEGVERDYDKALEWHYQYIGRLADIFSEKLASDDLVRLIGAMTDLVFFYVEHERFEEAKEECKELIDWSQIIQEKFGVSSYLAPFMYLQARIELGLKQQGKAFEDPRAILLKCCAQCKNEYEKNKSKEALQILAQSYLQLGKIADAEMQLTVAREFTERGIDHFRYLIEEDSDSVYRRVLSIALADYARMECRLNQYNSAQKHLTEALELTRALYDEHRTADLCEMAAKRYEQLGDFLTKTGNTGEAKSQYDQAEELYNCYKQQTMNIAADISLLGLYDSIAELYEKEGANRQAWEYYCREEALAEGIVRQGSEPVVSMVRWLVQTRKGGLLEKEGHVDEALNMYIAAYEAAESLAAQTGGVQQYGQLMPYVSAETIRAFAKKHRLKEYVRKYRVKKPIMLPKLSVSSFSSLKELWSKNIAGDGASFDLLATCSEMMGDMVNWTLEEDKFLGIRLQPIKKWFKENLYIWRIPFYPLLCMISLLLHHFVAGYMELGQFSLCYVDCLAGQTLYQCISSLAIAIVFALVRYSKRLKGKEWINIAASLLLPLLAGWGVMKYVGSRFFLPDTAHIAYLIAPTLAAGIGHIVTKMAAVFLDCVIKD